MPLRSLSQEADDPFDVLLGTGLMYENRSCPSCQLHGVDSTHAQVQCIK